MKKQTIISISIILVIATVLFLVIISLPPHDFSSFNIALVLLLITASFSMGVQFVCAKCVNKSGEVTTIITGTVSNLVSRLVSQIQSTSIGTNAVEPGNAAGVENKRWRHP